jgi:hypothetical protein
MKRIYAAYFTGATGQSMGMFFIGDGVLVGADVRGLKFDGTLSESSGSLEGVVKFTVPAGAHLITGLNAADAPQEISTNIKLPPNFDDGETVVRIDTPGGPINARFERLREIE